MNTKNIVFAVIILVIVSLVGFFITQISNTDTATNPTPDTTETPIPVEPDGGIGDGAEPLDELLEEERGDETIIGTSVEGNNIVAYHFGEGETELLLIGGIHGGYSWNTALLGYELIDYFKDNPSLVPNEVTVTVIPVGNPDGLEKTVKTTGRFSSTIASTLSDEARVDGRFNDNNVDLNRNFDCEWSETGTWRSQTVSGGDEAFSEPEAAAIRDYITANTPAATVVWFSAEGKVYPSACGGNPSTESVALANTFADAARYPTDTEFDAYAITGDMVNWMAKQGIPAISVLLSTHTDTELSKNKAGVEAIISSLSN